jgi:tyrosyl-DNA phosphodiesterase-1
MRVIVHTANLLFGDCNNKTQALYYQDFGLKDRASPGTSAFEMDLKDYVRKLRLPTAAATRTLDLISLHDYAPARVHLIGTVPSGDGQFRGNEMASWGHLKLRRVLESEPFHPKFAGAPILAQYSSVGSLSLNWLNAFAASMSAGRIRGGGGMLGLPSHGLNDFHLVWPTAQEVRDSLEGWWAGNSIPGYHNNVTKPFLMERYCAFGGAPVGRQRAMPHIKSYLR